jgi:hypothetical protein
MNPIFILFQRFEFSLTAFPSHWINLKLLRELFEEFSVLGTRKTKIEKPTQKFPQRFSPVVFLKHLKNSCKD